MSALTPQLVAEIVRHRLGELDASHSPRIIFLIPEALKLTARKIAANPHLRQLLITDKSSVTATLDADASIDLTELYETNRILLEYLDAGNIYLENNDYPLQLTTAQRAVLPQYLGNTYNYYYVDGDRLRVKDGNEGDEISFAVSYYPANLAQLPESEEVQTLFISKLIELIVGQDAAEDGEK